MFHYSTQKLGFFLDNNEITILDKTKNKHVNFVEINIAKGDYDGI